MASIEKIEQELEYAKVQLDEAKAELAKFGKDDEKLLGKLRMRLLKKEYKNEEEKNMWKGMVDMLATEKKLLRQAVEDRTKQVELFSTPTGNGFDHSFTTDIEQQPTLLTLSPNTRVTDLEIRNKLSKRRCFNESMSLTMSFPCSEAFRT